MTRDFNSNSQINLNEYKEVEQIGLFESKDFDKKNKLNRAADHKFTVDFLNKIEKEGLTYEQLLELESNVPIFKYFTQITVHGIFDTEITVYGVGGYKNLIINKNKSLGIRYNAIDYRKKLTLAKLVAATSKIGYVRNSTENYFSFVSRNAAETKEVFDRINTDLFLGTKQMFKFNYFGTWFYYCKIDVNALPLENINAIAENFTGETIATITETIAADLAASEKRSLELNAKWDIEKKERIEKNTAIENEILSTHKIVTFDGKVGFTALFIDKNNSYNPFTIFKYVGKKGAYHTVKKLSSDDLNELLTDIDFDKYNYRASKLSNKDLDVLIKIFNRKTLIEI